MNIAEQISERVTIPEVLSNYGYPLGRHQRIPCPIHNGKDSNFCYTNEVFHCWTCGAKGNVIGLVMQIFGLNFKEAIFKLNSDFNLGLTNKKPSREEQKHFVLQRKIEQVRKCLNSKNRTLYDEMCTWHKVVFQQICEGDCSPELLLLEKELEEWLDENIEEVLQPWD